MIVLNHGKKIEIKIKKENKHTNLLQLLQDNDIYISNSCHGNGTCGKCKVRVKNGSLAVTENERKILSKEALEKGIRLACKVKIEDVLEREEHNQLIVEVLESQEENIVVESVELKGTSKKNTSYFVAIDIGTTTIAMALVDGCTGEVCDTYVSVNHQRAFGADVVSRIASANAGMGEQLKQTIEEDLWNGIVYFLKKWNDINSNDSMLLEEKQEVFLSGIIIAGNTTMMHLLRGYSCVSLGKHPFSSECLEQVEGKLKDFIGDGAKKGFSWVNEVPAFLMSGISAFVGSDIVAGMLVCPGFENEKICYFLDLGTNGEMVMGNKDSMLATSVAAGPAFEGGNITCGTACIPGSICRVKISNGKPIIGTIDKKMPPVGMCGSGLISVIAQLLNEKLMDFQGNLLHPFQKEGFSLWTFSSGEKITLYQEDIRQFQMAKSAIRSGIEILRQEYGCQLDDIDKVYVAGGFGTNLVEEDIILSELLPREWKGKIEFLGNTSLLGSIKFGMMQYGNKEKEDSCLEVKQRFILDNIKTISLANNEEFQRVYIENLNFTALKN